MDKAEVIKIRTILKCGMNLPVQVYLDNAYSFVDERNTAQFTKWDDDNGLLYVFRLPGTEWSDYATSNNGQNLSVYCCDYDQIQGIEVSPLPLKHLEPLLNSIGETCTLSDDFKKLIINTFSKLLRETYPDPSREYYNKLTGNTLDTRDDYFNGKLTPNKGNKRQPEYARYEHTGTIGSGMETYTPPEDTDEGEG